MGIVKQLLWAYLTMKSLFVSISMLFSFSMCSCCRVSTMYCFFNFFNAKLCLLSFFRVTWKWRGWDGSFWLFTIIRRDVKGQRTKPNNFPVNEDFSVNQNAYPMNCCSNILTLVHIECLCVYRISFSSSLVCMGALCSRVMRKTTTRVRW